MVPRRRPAQSSATGGGRKAWSGRRPSAAAVFDSDLHVLDLGAGVMLDVFINVEGRLTTFLSVDGQLMAELAVAGEA